VQGVIAVCGAFIVNVLILCNSRGSIVGLLAMGCAAIALAGRGKRLKLMAIGAGGLVVLLALADNRFLERQQTTLDANDGSAQGRLESWRASMDFISDYPLGTGGRGFHILSPIYIPDIVASHGGEERSVHNTYLQLAAEWGIQGLVLWLGFIAATFLLLERSRRQTSKDSWYWSRYLTVELALIGTLIAGVFTNRLYGESVYWICALAFALHRMHATESSEAAETTVTVTPQARAVPSPAIVVANRAGIRPQ
jgi:O-antigen ligase